MNPEATRAWILKVDATMVCHEGHCCEATLMVRNMRGRAARGARLDSAAICVRRHCVRMYTTKLRCSINSGLQISNQASMSQGKAKHSNV